MLLEPKHGAIFRMREWPGVLNPTEMMLGQKD